MRKLTLLLALFVCSLAYANDIIILKNSTKIEAVITEVSDETVKYHKVSNPDGPIFVTKTSEISSILYDNGEVQVFNAETPQPEPAPQPQRASKLYNSGRGAHFQGMADLGLDFAPLYVSDYGYVFFVGPNIDFTFGARIRDYIFVGGGIGFFTLLDAPDTFYNLVGAMHANVRGYLPVSETTMPYLDFALGMNLGVLGVGTSYNELYCGFCTRVGLGVEYKSLNVSLGYELMMAHSLYTRVGIRF